MGQVVLGPPERGDGESQGPWARAESRELREDEPNPVRALPAGAELGQGSVVGEGLGVEEVLEGIHDLNVSCGICPRHFGEVSP